MGMIFRLHWTVLFRPVEFVVLELYSFLSFIIMLQVFCFLQVYSSTHSYILLSFFFCSSIYQPISFSLSFKSLFTTMLPPSTQPSGYQSITSSNLWHLPIFDLFQPLASSNLSNKHPYAYQSTHSFPCQKAHYQCLPVHHLRSLSIGHSAQQSIHCASTIHHSIHITNQWYTHKGIHQSTHPQSYPSISLLTHKAIYQPTNSANYPSVCSLT